ncbi:MAG: acyl CoA:acetate/3-ketoacid CoA transferase, partial [Betaproteobacteria bacterium HGW-Betaproteobacteria-21]
TFSGDYARKRGQPVVYITERCVFELGEHGLVLTEVAPGIDVERDILAHMGFRPAITENLRTMDERIFRNEPMGLREILLSIPLERRLCYDPQQDLFFVNFEGMSIRSAKEIDRIREQVEVCLAPVGHRVAAIVNYDNFSITPELLEPYAEMVRGLVHRHYTAVTRYTTSTFLRARLGDALANREIAPHLFADPASAMAKLEALNGGEKQ